MDEFFSFMERDCEVCGQADMSFLNGFHVRYDNRILPACDRCYEAAKEAYGELSVITACVPGG